MKNLKFILIAVVAILFSVATVEAKEQQPTLVLPSVVGSNMVLQHSTTVNVWGWAKPKAKVTVACDWVAGKPIKVKADKEGFWMTQVQTLAPGYKAHSMTIKSGKEVKELTNILFGEVWLCAGQSNMEWTVRKTPDMKGDLSGELNPNIRLYNTGHIYAATPQNDVPKQKKHITKWSVCNARDLKGFSAVGYGFGKELQEALDVPIGLIDVAYGGTQVEGWLSTETIQSNPHIVKILQKNRHRTWKGKESYLYNANIYPIRHATIAGVIWYQGCTHISSTAYWRSLDALVKSWRAEFRSEQLPFYIVQIAPHTYGGIRGAQVREAQAIIANKYDNCELVVTNDQNQIPGDIHPPKKGDVAHRLALCALGAHYKKSDAPFRSPAYESMAVEGDNVRVSFKNVPTTLVQKGEGRINGFQLGVKDPANSKKLIFTLAEAKIEGNTIVLSAEGVVDPVAVRYCFNEDVGNVYSAEGLPLAPFRSDKNNRSLSARPYVEKPSEIAVKFVGEGFTKSTFAEGSHVWPNLEYKFSDEMPKEFEGFEILTCNTVDKSEMSLSGTITAMEKGKIYVLTTNHGVVRKKGWKLLIPTWTRMLRENGKKWGTFYIAEREVEAGEVVELPKAKKYPYGAMLLAKTIEY